MTDEHAMKVAKVIAKAMGDNFSDAFKNKQRWTAKRGMSGGRFRDVNEPFQDDYIAAAQAAAAIIAADRAELVERVKVLEEELRKANLPIWFYHPDHAEVCQWSPQEVVDEYYDPKPGDYVFEVECARPLPSVWCAVRVTSDEDADERFTLTEHPTEELARAALKDTRHDADA